MWLIVHLTRLQSLPTTSMFVDLARYFHFYYFSYWTVESDVDGENTSLVFFAWVSCLVQVFCSQMFPSTSWSIIKLSSNLSVHGVSAIVSYMIYFVPLAGCWFSNCFWLCAPLPSSTHVSAWVIGDRMLQLWFCWLYYNYITLRKFLLLPEWLWWNCGGWICLQLHLFSSVFQWGSKLYDRVEKYLLYFRVIETSWPMNQRLRCWGKKHGYLIFFSLIAMASHYVNYLDEENGSVWVSCFAGDYCYNTRYVWSGGDVYLGVIEDGFA